MSLAPYQVAFLADGHDRSRFNCRSEPLNRYLKQQASQDIRRRVAACFVAIAPGQQIAGYYTLASAGVLLDALPASFTRKLPRYPSLPAIRLGRLAVDQAHCGRGLGAALLADALYRAIGAEIAACAMLVDAKDADAAAFYQHHGFIALPGAQSAAGAPLTLFLPLATARAAGHMAQP